METLKSDLNIDIARVRSRDCVQPLLLLAAVKNLWDTFNLGQNHCKFEILCELFIFCWSFCRWDLSYKCGRISVKNKKLWTSRCTETRKITPFPFLDTDSHWSIFSQWFTSPSVSKTGYRLVFVRLGLTAHYKTINYLLRRLHRVFAQRCRARQRNIFLENVYVLAFHGQ